MENKLTTLFSLLLIYYILILPAAQASTTLLSAKMTTGEIELDGHPIEEDWQKAPELIINVQDGSIGETEIILKALYDIENLYLYASWEDNTQSDEKDQWFFNGQNWSTKNDEDRFAFIWNIDDSINGFNIGGCAMLCHGDRMHTNGPGERGDTWQWKASRTNPISYADDGWIDDTVIPEYTLLAKTAAMHPDGSFSPFESAGPARRNINSDGTGPRFIELTPDDELDKKFLFQSEIDNGEAVEITALNQFSDGATTPGFILSAPEKNNGDINAKGRWHDGRWELEISRSLETGFENDVQFDINKNYRFGIALMDNTGGFEAFGRGHSFDLGARTLEFGGLATEEVTRLSLVKDYLTVAEAEAKNGQAELAVSNVGDAHILYNELSDEVAGKDAGLFLQTKAQFANVQRNPSIEEIQTLNAYIDDTIFTFQGKRTPPEPSLKVRVLVLWGKVQLFALILLAVLAIAPIIKALKLGRKPTFRRLSIFILVIVIPLLFEGLGRVGILFKIMPLQSFSFLTNELATLQWAILMFFGLFLAKSGFEEVENSMKSLEFYSTKLEEDLDKMKALQTELKRSEESYKGLFEASPIGIIEAGIDGTVLRCNDAASVFMSCPGGECNCGSILDFLGDEEDKKEVMETLMKGGTIKDRTVHIKGDKEEDQISSLSLRSIKDDSGKPVKAEIALMDITDRIRESEEKANLQKKLSDSMRLASIGKLAMGFAHEIGNPLTNIQLAAEILLRKVDDNLKPRVDVITKNVDLASSVVRNLLDFSKQTSLSLAPIELETVVDDSVDMVSPRLKNITVVKNLQKDITIMGDQKQLQQVFANIMINASQAMSAGGQITLTGSIEGSLGVIRFKDTGGGIPEEQLKHIFDPFFTTKEVGKGMGLGLSLAYGIIQAHNGEIKVKSKLGEGTEVEIRLPLAGR